MSENPLNIENGNFKINEKLLISKELKFEELKKLAPDNEIREIGNGFRWIYFNNLIIDKIYYYVSVCYNQNELNSIIFNVYKNKLIKNKSWNDWSEDEDLKQKKFLDKWMLEFIGKTKQQFIWGDIASYYDKRSLTTGIYINYKESTNT